MSNFIDDKEYEAALQEAEAVAGEELYCQTVKFRQAREWEGQTYDSLTFDWGKLTGEDFLAIELYPVFLASTAPLTFFLVMISFKFSANINFTPFLYLNKVLFR